jgi:hypothetical protein
LWALDALLEKGMIDIGVRMTDRGLAALAPKPLGMSDRNQRRCGWDDPVSKTRIKKETRGELGTNPRLPTRALHQRLPQRHFMVGGRKMGDSGSQLENLRAVLEAKLQMA